MNQIKCKNLQEWVEKAEAWLAGHKSKGAKSLFLPAGGTCVPIYQALNSKNSILNDFELYQIDEVITSPHQDLFKNFFKEHLGLLKREVQSVADAAPKVDLAWLGLGLNGHVGFHEPSIQESFNLGCVHLDDKTCNTLSIATDSWGITYGVGCFKKCDAIMMLARGEAKREVVSKLLKEDKSLPATYLLGHKDFTLLTEQI